MASYTGGENCDCAVTRQELDREGIFVGGSCPEEALRGPEEAMLLEEALGKLREHAPPFRFSSLPSERNDSLWGEIRSECGLTLEELSVLRNERCPLQPQQDTVGPAASAKWKEQFIFELCPVEVDVFSRGETEIVHGEHLLVKRFPEALVARYGNIPERIYVRDSYKTLYECAAQSRICQQCYSVTLFTGVPGIGKSLFLMYFIYRFLTDERFEDKRFALEFTRGEYLCFQPCGVPGEFWCSNENSIRMRSKQFLLLCDISDTVEPVSRAKWTYIFSSPNPARYKEILKNSPCQEYTLPTWSELELKFVSADIDSWYDDFVLFGGVPRYIFHNRGPGMSSTLERDPRVLLNNALEENGGALVEAFFNGCLRRTDALQNCMLVHINPPLSATGEFDYRGKTEYSFASDAIFQRLAEKHGAQMLAGAARMFNGGAAAESCGAVQLVEKG